MAQAHAAVQAAENDPVPTTTVETTPPGVAALEALVAKTGIPEPKDVVFVLDAHRGERDAIFAYLHKTLGAAYVRRVVEAADKLRLSVSNKELVAGDPSDPDDGYFLASAKEKGARWRTSDGDFTGQINQDGLDSTYRIDEDDRLHANVSAKDKTGTLSWLRDDETRAQLYGGFESGSNWHAGVNSNWRVGEGRLDTDFRHSVTDQGATDKLAAGYVTDDERTKAGLTVQHQDGVVTGELNGSHKLDNGATVNGALTRNADSTALTGAYQSDRTNVNGGVTVTDAGVVTGNLTGTHQLDNGATVNGALTRNADSTGLTAGYDSERTKVNGGLNVTDAGVVTGNLTGSHQLDSGATINGALTRNADSTGLTAGYDSERTKVNGGLNVTDAGVVTGNLNGTHQLDSGATINGGLTRTADATGLTGGYDSERTKIDGGLNVTDAGVVTGNLTGTHTLDNGATINGGLTRTADATSLTGGFQNDRTKVNGSLNLPDSGRWTGSLTANHQLDPQTQLYGTLARTEDRNSFELGGSRKTDNFDFSGSLKYEDIVGQGSQTSLKLSERYNSTNLIHGLDLDAGVGVRDYLTMTGSAEARLAENLYGSAWTSLKLEGGQEASAQLGGSLTFTPHERAALTLAGVVDQSGTLETRLQLDVFKDKINSLGALSKHKKDALFSLFVSYSTNAGPRQLDNRFGGPDQWQSGQGQIMGGIRINF